MAGQTRGAEHRDVVMIPFQKMQVIGVTSGRVLAVETRPRALNRASVRQYESADVFVRMIDLRPITLPTRLFFPVELYHATG